VEVYIDNHWFPIEPQTSKVDFIVENRSYIPRTNEMVHELPPGTSDEEVMKRYPELSLLHSHWGVIIEKLPQEATVYEISDSLCQNKAICGLDVSEDSRATRAKGLEALSRSVDQFRIAPLFIPAKAL
jgi:hypothetical protein